jgi:hypothetical protein
MKTVSLILALFAVVQAKQTPTAFTRALNVRGGGELGPLDGVMAMQLSKTAATAYVAGAASKYIATQSGGSGTQVRNYMDLFQKTTQSYYRISHLCITHTVLLLMFLLLACRCGDQ